jgi:integrase
MSIIKRGKSWQASVTHAGQRIRVSFKSEQDAKVWVKEAELAIARGQAPAKRAEGAGHVVEAGRTVLEVFRITHETRWSACWTSTMSDLGMKVAKELGESTPISQVGFKELAAWISGLRSRGVSTSSINRRLSAVSALLNTALEMGWIQAKPKIPYFKEAKRERRWLTDQEEALILKQLEGRLEWALVVVGVETGLRLSELLGLKWRACSATSVTVEKTKNGGARTVPLTSRAREVMAALPRSGGGPFETLYLNTVSRRFKEAAVAAGVTDSGVVFHSLRHTCASRLVMAGVDVRRVQMWLGHKSIQSTLVYAHLAPNSLADAVAQVDSRQRIEYPLSDAATICGKIGGAVSR